MKKNVLMPLIEFCKNVYTHIAYCAAGIKSQTRLNGHRALHQCTGSYPCVEGQCAGICGCSMFEAWGHRTSYEKRYTCTMFDDGWQYTPLTRNV